MRKVTIVSRLCEIPSPASSPLTATGCMRAETFLGRCMDVDKTSSFVSRILVARSSRRQPISMAIWRPTSKFRTRSGTTPRRSQTSSAAICPFSMPCTASNQTFRSWRRNSADGPTDRYGSAASRPRVSRSDSTICHARHGRRLWRTRQMTIHFFIRSTSRLMGTGSSPRVALTGGGWRAGLVPGITVREHW